MGVVILESGVVEVLTPVEGRKVTRQTFKGGMVMAVITAESLRPSKLVRTMTDDKGPFAGTWSYEFVPVKGGCRVALTEQGEFRNPAFRALARVFGLTKYADEHLQDLAAKFRETAAIE